MASSSAQIYSRIANENVRHSREDALSDREYQLFLEGCDRMRDYYGQHARFVALMAGRLGMRRAEIAHMSEEWVDYRRNMIIIPRHHKCTKGENGDVCGSCKQAARRIAENGSDLTYAEALETRWAGKTDAAAREIPFDHDARAQLCLERFFDKYDEYPCSCQSINRRVKKAAELADELDAEDVYPHCLRATAATTLAARGMDFLPLKAMMGWADLSTAMCYISNSGENTARALNEIYSR